MANPAAGTDPYSKTDQLDEDTLNTVAQRLENRGRDPYFTHIIEQYLERLVRDSGKQPLQVLELGCGTGLVSRLLASTPGFTGSITATDLSPGLIERAVGLAQGDGVESAIRFEAGDARALDLPVASFDFILAHTLVSHVPDVAAVFTRAAQLLKPGGQFIVCDGDFSSIVLGGSDLEQGARLSQAITDGMFTNPAVMRELPVIAKSAGLKVDDLVGSLLCEAGGARYFADLFPTLRLLLPKAGVATVQQATQWIDAQEADIASNVFFGSMNFFTWYLKRA